MLQWALTFAAAALSLSCVPTSTDEVGRTQPEVEEVHWQVLPLAALSTYPSDVLQVEGHASSRWQSIVGTSVPVVVAGQGAKIRFNVKEVAGARVRGGCGLPAPRRGEDGREAIFRITVTAADQHRALLEKRLKFAVPAPCSFDAAVPAAMTGPGRLTFEVSFADPEKDGRGLWFDPQVVLPVRIRARPPEGGDGRPTVNILIVTSDTTRQDVLGTYGGPAATPALDSFAADGMRLLQMYSVGYGTTPSHSSLFTGSHPRDHGVYDNKTVLRDGLTTLAEVLRDAGYETAAFVSSRPLARSLGLDQGFLTYDDIFAIDPDSGLGTYSHHERRGQRTTDRFLEWLDSNPAPFAAWVHFFEPHQPYVPPGGPPKGERSALSHAFRGADGEPRYLDLSAGDDDIPNGVTPEELDRAARRRYAAEVEAVDRQLARILAALRQRDAYRDTLVIFVSDHGENFLDRGGQLAYKHGGLYHEVTRLGAVIKLPGSAAGGRVNDMLVANSDLACLVLDVAGLDVPSTWTCRSFLPNLLPSGQGRPFRPYLVLEGASHHETAIRTPRWLYRQASPSAPPPTLERFGFRHGSRVLLFDLLHDPEERQDVSDAPESRAELARLRQLVDDFASHAATPGPQTVESEEHLQGLRALGYLN